MKYRARGVEILVLVFIAFLSACDIINPAEPVPTTIHLSPFDFQVDQGQGSSKNRITEVWVFANDNNIGTFAPPVDIHYLEEGPTTLSFRPGIRNNGLANDAIIYPLFEGYTIDITASPGSQHDVTPVTSYKAGTIFSLISDFEITNDFTYNRDTVASSELLRSQVDVFEGEYSGQIALTTEAYFIEVGHSVAMSGLPIDDQPIYLELRYKNEVEFAIGLLGIDLEGHEYSNFFYIVRPTDEWNMLYLDLTEKVKLSAFPAYKILFRALYPPSATKPTLNIFLDNIKVVHL
ncbi:MAG TPA: hypothetical protein VFF90_07445 [Saprospiraceae bacterium]|nr:hypothetical protein [Saprospiraceae bacterium]